MTGFIKKLFRSKSQDAEPTIEVIKPARVERGNAYYLNPDDAQTFGNLEYMRSTKTVRHTFPKGKVGKDNARIRSISYSTAANFDAAMPPAPLAPQSGQSASQSTGRSADSGVSSNASARRRPDSSMDMFRNMAREIKKS